MNSPRIFTLALIIQKKKVHWIIWECTSKLKFDFSRISLIVIVLVRVVLEGEN